LGDFFTSDYNNNFTPKILKTPIVDFFEKTLEAPGGPSNENFEKKI